MKFIADAMLGRLATWMRIAGYDVQYYPQIEDAEIAERGLREDIGRRMFTRCLRCNTLLVPIPRSSLRQKVTLFVFATQETFETCPSCRRIYWGATHRESMVRELARIIPDLR